MSVISGIVGASASKSAANKQADAAREATDVQLQMFREGQEATAPWREKGKEALNTLAAKIAAGPGKFETSPGYEFRLGEGTKAIERSAAAKGGLFSGRVGMELQRYGQGEASKEYNNWLANYYQSLAPYQSLAGVGQTTAMEGSRAGNAIAANVGQNTLAAGQAAAGGDINRANALTGAMNSGANNYLTWKYLNSRNPSSTTAVSGYASGYDPELAAALAETGAEGYVGIVA